MCFASRRLENVKKIRTECCMSVKASGILKNVSRTESHGRKAQLKQRVAEELSGTGKLTDGREHPAIATEDQNALLRVMVWSGRVDDWRQ